MATFMSLYKWLLHSYHIPFQSKCWAEQFLYSGSKKPTKVTVGKVMSNALWAINLVGAILIHWQTHFDFAIMKGADKRATKGDRVMGRRGAGANRCKCLHLCPALSSGLEHPVVLFCFTLFTICAFCANSQAPWKKCFLLLFYSIFMAL